MVWGGVGVGLGWRTGCQAGTGVYVWGGQGKGAWQGFVGGIGKGRKQQICDPALWGSECGSRRVTFLLEPAFPVCKLRGSVWEILGPLQLKVRKVRF